MSGPVENHDLPHPGHVGGHALERQRQAPRRCRPGAPPRGGPAAGRSCGWPRPCGPGPPRWATSPTGADPRASEPAPQLLEAGDARERSGPGRKAAPFSAPIEHPSTSSRRDVVLDERSEHADLDRAVVAAPGQHERHRAGPAAEQVAELPHQAPVAAARSAPDAATAPGVGQVGAVARPLHDVELARGAPTRPARGPSAGGAGRDSLPWAATHRHLAARWGRTAVAPAGGASAARPPAPAPRPAAGHASRSGSASQRSSPTMRRMNRSAASVGRRLATSGRPRRRWRSATTAATPSAPRRRPPPGRSSGCRAAKASATTPPRL